jgi:hypothetical protein
LAWHEEYIANYRVRGDGSDLILINEDYLCQNNSVNVVEKEFEHVDDEALTYIYVNYYQIEGLADQGKQDQINDRLSDFNEYYDINEMDGIYISIVPSYEIIGDRLLSVIYDVDYYDRAAPHPWVAERQLNIDLDTGEILKLSDFIDIDDRLLTLFKDGYFIEGRIALESFLEEMSFDDLYDSLFSEFAHDQFYLLSDSFGLACSVPHSIGDYETFETSYGNIYDLIKPPYQTLFDKP